ncbi:MAG: UvrD-helicase domain-containing protein [Alphaproteobacteria bacterium]|jgi:DNA helicase-2/ATP-dependent DNA helicase PcrA|nr:UvrD-helicase domain-containing protein [Alphaproteobacteria bacterium]MDP6589107.1 UvrD-helicase domain-containing protein [Alphaproteobacteria bacterium]MDP6818498.1 UvrD-helicase domain-containing protein [Alphaproteobacteria bacterium]
MSDPFDLAAVAEDEPATLRSDAPEPAYLAALNSEQRAAVEAVEGPVLVLAGAGTGKTRVLTTRLAHILFQGKAFPGEILAVTFTNKAAREMTERVSRLIGRPAEGLWLGTFHAMAARILRRHAELVGLKPDFTILDSDDQVRLLKQLIRAADVDEKRWPARTLSIVVQRWKDRGLTPDKVASADGAEEFANGKAPELYRRYQERLKTVNAADFGDLLMHNLTIFTAEPEVLALYERRFKYILVDEYQDTNVAQYLWLRLLARARHNICCVGDDDQSIYGWRGAEVGNILRFDEDFPGAEVIRLERNYRSTGHILGAASGLIAHNAGRLGKTLWTEGGDGEKVGVTGCWDGDEEARIVGEAIEALQRGGESIEKMAILVRAGFQTRAFEERFVAIDLPYRVIGGLRFYERQEIRDAVAYLRVLAQRDDDLAFERIVNLPRRGLGDATLGLVHRLARASDCSLYNAAEMLVETDELKAKPRGALAGLLKQFAAWRALAKQAPHWDVLSAVLDESGYLEMWKKDKTPQAPGRLENLEELTGALEEFESLSEFLEHVSLVMDREEGRGEEMVNLMTLHGAKGLEFDSVFLPGWEEGLFPHQLALDESGAEGLEEERRLAYVGLTRARKRAHILSAANRHIHNQWVSALPSRFIDELPADHSEARNRDGFPVVAAMETASGGTAAFSPRRPRARPSAQGLDAETWKKEPAEGSLAVGARIFHQKFGYGRIRSVDGSKLSIAFEKAGEKKVIDRFIEPA